MPAHKAVSIIHNGQRYNATFTLDGKIVAVSSAYGWKTGGISKGGNAEATARAILTEMAKAWRP